jgi:hypothetical protein
MHARSSQSKALAGAPVMANNALLSNAFRSLRCACGAAKRGR